MCVNAPEAVIEMAVRIQATIDCPEIEAFKEMVDQFIAHRHQAAQVRFDAGKTAKSRLDAELRPEKKHSLRPQCQSVKP